MEMDEVIAKEKYNREKAKQEKNEVDFQLQQKLAILTEAKERYEKMMKNRQGHDEVRAEIQSPKKGNCREGRHGERQDVYDTRSETEE
jgi:hypothetical protein